MWRIQTHKLKISQYKKKKIKNRKNKKTKKSHKKKKKIETLTPKKERRDMYVLTGIWRMNEKKKKKKKQKD